MVEREKFNFKFDELKQISDEGEFEGFGAVTGNQDSHQDIIEPGAFKRTINSKKGIFPLLWQHNSDEPIGTVDVEERTSGRKTGLFVKGTLLMDVDKAREARSLAIAGALGGMSIGFQVPRGKQSFNEETGVRRIKEIKLWEVSLVTFPANERATIDRVKDELHSDTCIICRPGEKDIAFEICSSCQWKHMDVLQALSKQHDPRDDRTQEPIKEPDYAQLSQGLSKLTALLKEGTKSDSDSDSPDPNDGPAISKSDSASLSTAIQKIKANLLAGLNPKSQE